MTGKRIHPRELLVPNGKDCVVWSWGRSSGGYGQRWSKGKVRYVHIEAWETTNGPVPEGLCVLHYCDNPPCYNIDHLFLGTHQQNMEDRSRKDRGRRKFTNAEAVVIRQRVVRGERQIDLAKEHGVSPQVINLLVKGRNYKYA